MVGDVQRLQDSSRACKYKVLPRAVRTWHWRLKAIHVTKGALDSLPFHWHDCGMSGRMKSSGTLFSKRQRVNARLSGLHCHLCTFFSEKHSGCRDANCICAGLQQQIATLKGEKTHRAQGFATLDIIKASSRHCEALEWKCGKSKVTAAANPGFAKACPGDWRAGRQSFWASWPFRRFLFFPRAWYGMSFLCASVALQSFPVALKLLGYRCWNTGLCEQVGADWSSFWGICQSLNGSNSVLFKERYPCSLQMVIASLFDCLHWGHFQLSIFCPIDCSC